MPKGIGFIKLYSVYLNMSCVFRNEISKQPGLTFPGTMVEFSWGAHPWRFCYRSQGRR